MFCCLSGKIAKLQNPVFLETKGMIECWQSGCNASIMKMSFPLVNKWAKIIDNDDKEFCEELNFYFFFIVVIDIFITNMKLQYAPSTINRNDEERRS